MGLLHHRAGECVQDGLHHSAARTWHATRNAAAAVGKSTRMVDLDASGRVVQSREVLTASALMEVQASLPGMAADTLLRTLGRPGERRGGGWQGGEVWSRRYQTNDCLWFQVSLGTDRRARDGGFDVDPACDSRDTP